MAKDYNAELGMTCRKPTMKFLSDNGIIQKLEKDRQEFMMKSGPVRAIENVH